MAWYSGRRVAGVALQLRLALVDIPVLLEVDGPILLLAGGVLNLKFEDTICLRGAREEKLGKQASKFPCLRGAAVWQAGCGRATWRAGTVP